MKERSAPALPGADSIGKAKPHQAGHRDRLRNRFLKAGPGALADYEILEFLLFRTLPRIDTKPIAKALLGRFGTISDVLAADPSELEEVKGIGPAAIADLKIIKALAEQVGRDRLQNRPVLSSWQSVIDYCRTAMAHEPREQLRILFLDKKNRLITDEIQQTGTVDHTPVYPREVVRRALELSSTAIILVHNHPSGDPTPSEGDIKMTAKIVEAAGHLGIAVHDHLIIGRADHASFRAMGLID